MIERDVEMESEPWDDSATVCCPHCGEFVEIRVDPSAGPAQQYVEDCYVCCRPWQVSVRYPRAGSAEVRLEATD